MSGLVALLDVNVLVALFDPDHVHHEPAHRWFEQHRPSRWATCPLTENGLVRVLGSAAYRPEPIPLLGVVERLRAFRASGQHVFWADAVSLTDAALFRGDKLTGPRQITDVYLLGLAVHHGGRLATFDRGIPLHAVKGARQEHLAVVPA